MKNDFDVATLCFGGALASGARVVGPGERIFSVIMSTNVAPMKVFRESEVLWWVL